MTEEGPPPPKRVKLSRGDLESMTKEEILEKWQEREAFVDALVSKQSNHVGENNEEQEKVKQQQLEATRRENVLVMRLTTKEQEMQEYMNQIAELKQAQNTSTAQLRSMLLDPAINLMFQRMKKEMDACKEKLEQAQNDLAAWKFTPDSQTGKRLMAKCRMLLQENEELGKIISSGRTAKLEGEIALEKTLVAEMKKGQAEMDEFVIELDEDVEGMQSTIYFLQQQLKETKEQLGRLQTENEQLKAQCSALSTAAPPTATASGDSGIGVGSPEASSSGARTSPPQPSLPPAPPPSQTVPDDAKRTAPPTLAAYHTPASCGGRTDGTPPDLSPSEEDEASLPSRQLVSNHSLSQNHASAGSATPAGVPGTRSSETAGLANNNSKSHPLPASHSAATNGAHRPGPALVSTDLVDSDLADGPSKQTGLSSSDVENDDEDEDDEEDDMSQSESPSQTPHFHHHHHHHHHQKEHKHGPPNAGGRFPSTDGAYGTENTDATSSDGWSPSASKHSGSVGHVDDGSSSPSEAGASTDAKSVPETLHNGLVSGGSGTPGYDTPGDEET